MKNFSMTFHKKFHIKIFLTKNYGFYVKNGRNLRPTLYGFHMCFSYVFDLLKRYRQNAYVNTASAHFWLLADLFFEEAYLSSTPRL